jgi:hypothetical protein
MQIAGLRTKHASFDSQGGSCYDLITEFQQHLKLDRFDFVWQWWLPDFFVTQRRDTWKELSRVLKDLLFACTPARSEFCEPAAFPVCIG